MARCWAPSFANGAAAAGNLQALRIGIGSVEVAILGAAGRALAAGYRFRAVAKQARIAGIAPHASVAVRPKLAREVGPANVRVERIATHALRAALLGGIAVFHAQAHDAIIADQACTPGIVAGRRLGGALTLRYANAVVGAVVEPHADGAERTVVQAGNLAASSVPSVESGSMVVVSSPVDPLVAESSLEARPQPASRRPSESAWSRVEIPVRTRGLWGDMVG